MTCIYPLRLKSADGYQKLVACGRCVECRIRRKQCWVGRLVLEHASSLGGRFLTLTYENEPVPEFQDGRQISFAMKRFRKHYGPMRFFGVSEYGGRTGRYHHHVLVFGPNALKIGKLKGWDLGHTHVGFVTQQSIAYCAGYTLKGEKSATCDPTCRMSLRPGIGLKAIHDMGKAAAGQTGLQCWPRRFHAGEKWYPLMDGALECFKRAYLENGGMPPPEEHPLRAHNRALEYVRSGGSNFDKERASIRQDYEDDDYGI